MRIINKKYLLTILLVGVILTSVTVLKPKEEVRLDNVILKQEVNNKTFAMYKEDNENNYVPFEENKFPDMYVLNLTKSKCIDNNGNEIKDALSYENDKVVLKSNRSSYCYLYFDKSLGEEIKEKNPEGLKTDTVRGEMYRFQGQQSDGIDNYICFGTNDLETCKGDTDKYMYRIIGIEAETGRVKVIKKEALDQTYQWHTSYVENKKLPDSVFFTAISGDKFLTNKDYIPLGWIDKISNNTWMYGDMWSNDILGAKQTGEGLYQTETGKKETRWYNWADEHTAGATQTTVGYQQSEYYGNPVYYTNVKRNWTETFDGKVSLMYIHDYHYSVSDEANCQYDASSYEICKTGWMHLSQNDQSAPSEHEWTMSRYGWDIHAGWFLGHAVYGAGSTDTPSLRGSFSVRPVFFIDASQKLKSGTGTLEDPFIIEF